MSSAKELKEKLAYKPKNGLLRVSEEEKKQAFDFCEGYMRFLDDAKTEREAVEAEIGRAHV